VLTDANNAKADLTISPPPAPEVGQGGEKELATGQVKGDCQHGGTIPTAGAALWAPAPDQIKEGDTFRVKTVKTRRE